MDEYIDNPFSSSSWATADVKERSSWDYRETGQPNVLLPTSLRLFENDKGNFPLNLFSSKQSVWCLPNQDTSSLVPDTESNISAEISGEAQLDKRGQYYIDKASPVMNGSLKIESMCLQYESYDTALPTLDSLNLSYPKQLHGVDDLTPSLSFTWAGSVGCNYEQFEYLRSFENLQNLSSLQQSWPSACYRGVSSVSAVGGQETTGQFGIQERNLDDEMDYIAKRFLSMDQIMLDKLSASVTKKDKEDLENYPVSSFTVGPNITTATNGVSFLSQTTTSAGTDVCNGIGKVRVRARRGQATDPHSIAERLRREKIAERMKNLQELVPNSSKIDKASMLDEIIEYVKFLQLQVKVLSMSRLGAAGAVIPLITHGQTEGSNSMSLLSSAGLGIDISPSADQIAFEQEILELMESDMTMAIQRLQSKGLCLMPIALAAAISNGKA